MDHSLHDHQRIPSIWYFFGLSKELGEQGRNAFGVCTEVNGEHHYSQYITYGHTYKHKADQYQ